MHGFFGFLVAKKWLAYDATGDTNTSTTSTSFSWSAATGYDATIPVPRFAEIWMDVEGHYSTGGTAAGAVTPTAGMRYLPANTPIIVQLPSGSDPTVKVICKSGTGNASVNFGL